MIDKQRGVASRSRRPIAEFNEGVDMFPAPDPPPIAEDEISKGMMHLINKGLIPKDVDLTPAFERGAPPLSFKAARIYHKAEAEPGGPRREVQTGSNYSNTLKFDMQPRFQKGKQEINTVRDLVPLMTHGKGSTSTMKLAQLALPSPYAHIENEIDESPEAAGRGPLQSIPAEEEQTPVRPGYVNEDVSSSRLGRPRRPSCVMN